ncbi:hypothetical protein CDAR_100671, partial [Caerostris darwini]
GNFEAVPQKRGRKRGQRRTTSHCPYQTSAGRMPPLPQSIFNRNDSSYISYEIENYSNSADDINYRFEDMI